MALTSVYDFEALSITGQPAHLSTQRGGIAQGILCGASLRCGKHLEAGFGIKVAEAIVAGGSIRAGESLSAGEKICAGPGYGVFAGLCVQHETWESSALVSAGARPERLMSGCWAGAY